MDFFWLVVTFAFGFIVRLTGLPPLIGFLLAGFGLNFLGVDAPAFLNVLANLGITLMLFTIGLKLHVPDLLKREIWLGAVANMLLWTVVFVALILVLGLTGLVYLAQISMPTAALLGFALSFSSTVCVVKLLEESGETKTRHGKLAIGMLIMQDVVAVIFLVIATGKIPSLWAIGLFALYFARPLLGRLLEMAGHGELLPLSGFFLALGSYELFEAVGVKGDLGALIVGMLLSTHGKATELTKSLMSFKDLFLIGFFLSIGFVALPDQQMVITGALVALLLPIKFILFFGVLALLQLRARTAFLSGLVMSNYSEFGLIVAALCVSLGILSKEWLVITALAVCFSFIVTSVLYPQAHRLFTRYKDLLRRYESEHRLREDVFHQPKDAEVLIVGIGRVGRGAYDALSGALGGKVWAMDADRDRIMKLRKAGKSVMLGDAEDAEFWEYMDLSQIKLVMLALPSIGDMVNIYQQLKKAGFTGQVVAIARYEDDRKQLLDAGLNKVFNFYTEAGTGFAEESLQLLLTQRQGSFF
ncbi:cation:proton antiporter family protein [Bowmanella sp. JS7-9]|uniref:Cation:proton antiporter n=1 Tax=Pseudobowmanella zhangzhouensis TaxID=1537679 RepID=A0ABW1XL51_9ALTE|nr:cation:proton antiporter family protein [Bowmanella sp. JS7-9]TBX26033.1 potassium transporter Kef [Bowmanella sp. JS7-9]